MSRTRGSDSFRPEGRPLAPALSVATLLAVGCGGGSPAAEFRVEARDGIPHSVAANAPERGDVELQLLWEAPSADAILDGGTWADPTRIAADTRGIAVLDTALQALALTDERIYALASDPHTDLRTLRAFALP